MRNKRPVSCSLACVPWGFWRLRGVFALTTDHAGYIIIAGCRGKSLPEAEAALRHTAPSPRAHPAHPSQHTTNRRFVPFRVSLQSLSDLQAALFPRVVRLGSACCSRPIARLLLRLSRSLFSSATRRLLVVAYSFRPNRSIHPCIRTRIYPSIRRDRIPG